MNFITRTFSKIFKSSNQQELDKIRNLILAINNKESEIQSLSDTDFKEKTSNFKKTFKMVQFNLSRYCLKHLRW